MEELKLFHFSTHPDLIGAEVGTVFWLNPGKQNAEGFGVYFAEAPRKQASDAIVTGGKSCTGCVVIHRPCKTGWWVTSNAQAKKKNRPKSWHSCGSSLELKVDRIEILDEERYFHCTVLQKTPVVALRQRNY